jgi:5-methylcytosine-specific restriction endonuclease McrA
MSKKSDAVKKWRKNTKHRLLQAMGGKCVICQYDKCETALEFHHLDPKEKDFGLGAARASIKNWNYLVEEVKKCVILCSRCHREYHEGLVQIPKVIPQFDEKLEDYKELARQELLDECPICGTMKNKANTTCSLQCGAKIRYKINWEDVDLKTMYDTMSMTQIAEKLGVSDKAVGKRLKKLGLKK